MTDVVVVPEQPSAQQPLQMPLLPLRDVVVFPHMVIPLFVGRPKSIQALEAAMLTGKSIMLVAQRSAAKDDPAPEDLYAIGAIATILQMLKLPDGTVKVLVEGAQRARLGEVTDAAFTRAFFALWLDPRTRAPALRDALLGRAGTSSNASHAGARP